MASISNNWMVPTLSLETELSRALDRRTAAHLCRNDLSIVVDDLIMRAYGQKALIDSLLGRVRCLEVELVLARDARPLQLPSDEHQRWAREVLQGLG
jgi:hypothetical protein